MSVSLSDDERNFEMARIQPVQPEQASDAARKLLDAVKRQLGLVPNIFKTLAQSPAVLDAYLKQMSALASGDLDPKLREQIALVAAGKNQCDYCASAHTLLGKGAGVAESELANNLKAQSTDTTTQAALSFAAAIVDQRGRVADSELAAVRQAGFSDGQIVEIIAVTCMNIFTNYFNHIADTEVDFPLVSTFSLSQAV